MRDKRSAVIAQISVAVKLRLHIPGLAVVQWPRKGEVKKAGGQLKCVRSYRRGGVAAIAIDEDETERHFFPDVEASTSCFGIDVGKDTF